MLPDDDLLGIFDFCVTEGFRPSENRRIEEWETLVHVCRRWRSLVFQSPHRLNLRLLCTPNTRARNTLDVWPPFPLIIRDFEVDHDSESSKLVNVIAALEHNDRVCQIQLKYFTCSELKYITDSPAIHKPFLELTDLRLRVDDNGPEPILPDSFLAGAAPRLRSLELDGIPFPGVPKVLLSAAHLVKLDLSWIPPSGYIPPEAMATCLFALNNLEVLRIHFLSPEPRPALEGRRPPPSSPTRSILPSLTETLFEGASEYLEEILAGIDAPRLNKMFITFFDHILFNTPQPFQFASRSPTLRALEKGYIIYYPLCISVRFSCQTSDYRNDVLIVKIPYTESGWPLSSLKRVFTSSLPSVSTLKDLYIQMDNLGGSCWSDHVENTLWLEFLHPFAAVKNLYVAEEFVPRVVPALQYLVGGRTTEVLPTLENLFLEGIRPSGPLLEAIEKFVGARRLTNRPVAVSRYDTGFLSKEIYGW
jgi:hypothetical protein